MKLLKITDDEVVTMDDYPIYDLRPGVSDGVIIKLYFRIFQKKCDDIVARTIVLPKELVIPVFNKITREKFELFEKNHPKVKYFAADGNHRTTAASLAQSKIPVILLENDQDCIDIQKMNDTSEVFRPYTNSSINEYLIELNDHFSDVKQFHTVTEKTKKMVEDPTIEMPQYMRDSFLQEM